MGLIRALGIEAVIFDLDGTLIDSHASVERSWRRLADAMGIDYATAPGVGTMAKVAMELPGVFMTRTFSKAYGMAGMRMGYAIGQPATLQKLAAAWGLGSLNELQDFVRYLQPKKIFPCDVPKDMKYEEVSLDWSLEAPTVRFSFGKCRIFFLVKYIRFHKYFQLLLP